jgi:iron complex transport system substrate-binding protein
MQYKSFLFALIAVLAACSTSQPSDTKELTREQRIVSLHGTATEVLYALGYGDQIVLRDVTSTYPPEVDRVPNAGHVSGITAESILAAQPNLLFVAESQLKPSVREQLQSSGVQIVELAEPNDFDKGLQLLSDIAKAMDVASAAKAQVASSYHCLPEANGGAARVLFVYGRGSGNFLVGGGGTPVHAFIEAAGGVNVASEVDGFKPLSAEALLSYDPEVVLMFEHSFEAAGGMEGVLQVPGMSEVTAGKEKRIYHFPGQQINGFGPRTCDALTAFHQLLFQ